MFCADAAVNSVSLGISKHSGKSTFVGEQAWVEKTNKELLNHKAAASVEMATW